MNANQLMIDDWVLYENTPYQISEIGQIISLEYRHAVMPREIEPIPLTEEIVIKNGLNEPEFFKGYWLMVNKEGGFFIEDHVTMIFRYVHELQHALKLCGINKDIKL